MRPGLALLALAAAFALAAPLARAEADEAPGRVSAERVATGGGEAASEHQAPQISGKRLALQLLNLGALVFLLVKFGGPAVGKALLARHEQLKADLAAAAEARASAEAHLRAQDQRLAALEGEIAALRRGVEQEAEAERVRLIALAEERARRTREETRFVIEQQIKEAAAKLRHEVALAAVEEAEKLVRRSLDARDRQRMLDSFVTEVDTALPAGGSGGRPRGQA